MVVDFACEIRIVLVRRLQNHLIPSMNVHSTPLFVADLPSNHSSTYALRDRPFRKNLSRSAVLVYSSQQSVNPSTRILCKKPHDQYIYLCINTLEGWYILQQLMVRVGKLLNTMRQLSVSHVRNTLYNFHNTNARNALPGGENYFRFAILRFRFQSCRLHNNHLFARLGSVCESLLI